MAAAGAIRRKKLPAEPYKVLAQLPLPIYITTNSNNLLAQALKEAGKDPQVAICPWNEVYRADASRFMIQSRVTSPHRSAPWFIISSAG